MLEASTLRWHSPHKTPWRRRRLVAMALGALFVADAASDWLGFGASFSTRPPPSATRRGPWTCEFGGLRRRRPPNAQCWIARWLGGPFQFAWGNAKTARAAAGSGSDQREPWDVLRFLQSVFLRRHPEPSQHLQASRGQKRRHPPWRDIVVKGQPPATRMGKLGRRRDGWSLTLLLRWGSLGRHCDYERRRLRRHPHASVGASVRRQRVQWFTLTCARRRRAALQAVHQGFLRLEWDRVELFV
mmetsp:Transcript_72139/g.200098  ORF Transcript_72139/g.200098 Transcript_72139/m.200098 type:complete len:243 (-) Transcript_72139:372-1100(-)